MDDASRGKSLTGTQKTGFVLLLVFGLSAISLGMLQMRNTIYNPFAVRLSSNSGMNELLNNEEARLQSIDTDRDGLNDWEEINFYQTSAYLPDTDSDGASDKQEINDGTDPLCPKGEVCESAQAVPEPSKESISSPLGSDLVTPEDILLNANLNVAGEGADVFSAFSDPKKVRQMILSAGGISEAELNKIDDETLMKKVNELLAAGQTPAEAATNTANMPQ